MALLCVESTSRTPVMALACTHALGKLYDDLIEKYKLPPSIRIVDLMVFVMASAWTILASLFYPDTFIPSHLRALLRYTQVSPQMAQYLQERYTRGQNPRSCIVRHEGMTCRAFVVPFTKQVLQMALRMYVPVHFMSLLFALRKWRHPEFHMTALMTRFVERLVRSCAYIVTYVVSGWTGMCMTQAFGDKSLWHRRLQWMFWGGVPGLSILFESSSRRRPIGVILCSYAVTTMGSRLVQRVPMLQQRNGNVLRQALDLLAVGCAMAYTSQESFDRNLFLRRILYGSFPTMTVLSSSDTHKQAQESNDEEVDTPMEAMEAATVLEDAVEMQVGKR